MTASVRVDQGTTGTGKAAGRDGVGDAQIGRGAINTEKQMRRVTNANLLRAFWRVRPARVEGPAAVRLRGLRRSSALARAGAVTPKEGRTATRSIFHTATNRLPLAWRTVDSTLPRRRSDARTMADPAGDVSPDNSPRKDADRILAQRMLQVLRSGKDVRQRKVRRLRAAVKVRAYENPLKLQIALDRLAKDLDALPPIGPQA